MNAGTPTSVGVVWLAGGVYTCVYALVCTRLCVRVRVYAFVCTRLCVRVRIVLECGVRTWAVPPGAKFALQAVQQVASIGDCVRNFGRIV